MEKGQTKVEINIIANLVVFDPVPGNQRDKNAVDFICSMNVMTAPKTYQLSLSQIAIRLWSAPFHLCFGTLSERKILISTDSSYSTECLVSRSKVPDIPDIPTIKNI